MQSIHGFQIGVVLVASLCATSELRGIPQFEASHVFVSCAEGNIVEFDMKGKFIREWVVASADTPLGGIAFGPDGNLYVAPLAIEGELLRLTPDGVVTPTGVEIPVGGNDITGDGQNGFLVTGLQSRTIQQVAFQEPSVPILGSVTGVIFGDPFATEVAMDGTWFVSVGSSTPAGAGVKRTLPFDTKVIEKWSVDLPTAVLFGSRGVLVADHETGVAAGPLGGPFTHFPGSELVDALDLVRHPNGNILATCRYTDRVVEIDHAGIVKKTWTHDRLRYPQRIAVAPVIFTLKLAGRVTTDEVGPSKIKGGDARLVVSPSGASMFLVFPPGSFIAPDATQSVVMNLIAQTAHDPGKARLIRGHANGEIAGMPCSASILLSWKESKAGAMVDPASRIGGSLHLSYGLEEERSIGLFRFKGKRKHDP